MYKITLTIGDKTYKAEGESVLEAILKLEEPKNVKARGILKAEFNGLTSQRRLNRLQIQYLWCKDFFREITAKNLTTFLR